MRPFLRLFDRADLDCLSFTPPYHHIRLFHDMKGRRLTSGVDAFVTVDIAVTVAYKVVVVVTVVSIIVTVVVVVVVVVISLDLLRRGQSQML